MLNKTVNKDALLVKSSFAQAVDDGGLAVIWHSLFGNPMVVSISTLEFLELFNKPKTLNAVVAENDIETNYESIANELIENYYLIPGDLNERGLLERKMKKREKAIV